ncbi:MAG: ATP-binding cassette domain-containing protein, partial [Saprospiraceae bacterium]|nr:ATP-binding cassette domain-containing protein [Saprospiraceae bacterium]
MINIQHLDKRYGRTIVLQDLSVDLNKAGITAILGPNGSGKTTLLKCLLGLVIPDCGEIYFDQQTIRDQHSYRQKISQVSQIGHFPENLSAEELIKMSTDIRPGASRVGELIDLFELDPELKKKMGHL